MKDYFERAGIFDEARDAKPVKNPEKKKGLPLAAELLIFVMLFLVGTFAELLFMVPGELLLIAGDPACQWAREVGEEGLLREAMEFLAMSDKYVILMLFADCMLIAVVFLFCRFLQKRKLRTLGFVKKNVVSEYLWGALIGFAMFTLAVIVCVVTGALRINGFSQTFHPVVFLFFVGGYMIQGMAEEVLCRGYLMVSIARRQCLPVAILSNSLLFAALHLANDGITVLAFVNLVLFGVFASLLFIRRGSIWMVGAVHSVWNLVQGNVYGIRVSGMVNTCSVLETLTKDGMTVINGGSFGLEGGLAVTLVLGAGIVLLALPKKKTA